MFSSRSAVAAKLFRSLLYLSSSYIRKTQIISTSGRKFDVNPLIFIAFVLPINRKLKEASKETKNDANDITSEADILFENRQYQQCFELLSAYPDKDDIEVQWRITRALYNISKEMKIDKQLKKRLIYEAYDIIYRSLENGWDNSNVHKWYALLLDEKSSYVGTKERIKQLEIVRKHMDLAVTLNPKDATTLHMLGEWCFQVTELPWHQRKIAETFFAKPPVSSYEDALEYFLLAETVQPRFYSLNLLRLGICYLRLEKVDQARYYLKLAADYPASTNDDHLASKQAGELLNKINKKYKKVEKIEKLPEQL